jgi:hypothetical protein
MLKRIIKYVLILTVISCIGFFLFMQFLKSDLNASIDETAIDDLAHQITNAESFPDSFYRLYDSLERVTNTNKYIISNLFNSELGQKSCPCMQVAQYHSTIRGKSRLLGNEYVLSWKLEKKVSQTACLNYVLSYTDFTRGNTGIRNASLYFYNQPLNDLTIHQQANLIRLMKNPLLYKNLR